MRDAQDSLVPRGGLVGTVAAALRLPGVVVGTVGQLPGLLSGLRHEFARANETLSETVEVVRDAIEHLRSLEAQSETAMADMERALAGIEQANGHLTEVLGIAEPGISELRDGVARLREANASITEIQQLLPPVAKAAEGLKTVEQKVGLDTTPSGR